MPLTRAEFGLLQAFVQRPGRALSRDYLLQVLAGREADAFDRLLEAVVERLAEFPILLVISFRPDFAPPWIGRPGSMLLTLSRLDRRQSAELAARLAGPARPSRAPPNSAAVLTARRHWHAPCGDDLPSSRIAVRWPRRMRSAEDC